MIHYSALGGIAFRREEGVTGPFTDAEHARIHERAAHVLRTSACPDCASTLVTTRRIEEPVADDGWHSYGCKNTECVGSSWSYHFWPGARRLVLSGAPISTETDPLTGMYKLHAAVQEMLETGVCCVCGGRHLKTTYGRGGDEPPREPVVFACEEPDCGMVWKTVPEAILGRVRMLRNRLDRLSKAT